MVKLQEVKGQYTITLPRDKVIQAGWQKHEELTIDYDRRTSELIIGRLKK